MDNNMQNNYILEMRNITKAFNGNKALDNVTFQVRKAQIHGLVGENGAGKSTIMKILAGIYSLDEGTILFEGADITKKITAKAIEDLGISFIHQERYVVPHLTIAEMLFLGKEETRSSIKIMQRKKMEKKAEDALREYMGVELPGNKLISELTVGEQQLVQICRALLNDPKIIVFDEPTAVLAKKEADILFGIIRKLSKDRGVIYISHYFGEILDLCDEVTVLRNGQKITTVTTEGMTIDKLVSLMIGRDVKTQYPPRNRVPGDVVIKVENLTHEKYFKNVSFEIRSGEILGLTGLMGSGHDMVGVSLFNAKGISSGSVEFLGKKIHKPIANKSVKHGIGYVPDDRRGLGAMQIMTVKENETIASLKKASRNGVINAKAEKSIADDLVKELNIKTESINTQCGFLSGGNQQKVVLAKWLSSDAKLYILNQPTAGVDVGARAEIYSIIDRLAREGAAVLLVTQDIQELYNMSDRIITMYRGEINMQANVEDCTEEGIIVTMMGGNTHE